MVPKIMVVDDDPALSRLVVEGLSGEHVTAVGINTSGALARISEDWDLVLVSMHLPDSNGLALLREMRERQHDQVIVMMTPDSSVETAVEAMRLGADHYVPQPITASELVTRVRKILEKSILKRELRPPQGRSSLEALVGKTPAMACVRELVRRVAASDASTVLITGESGTGKDLVARTIHHESGRARGPLMTITCTAISEQLLESELFGHEKGAFTNAYIQKKGLLEVADGGTVFLDEIGDLSMPLQAKLLRFLEEKTFKRVGGTRDIKVDVRIIAATHQPLAAMVEDGRLRQDLYYRLKVVDIAIPPLRSRIEDIPLLTARLVVELGHELGHRIDRVTPAAEACIRQYGWPGNVRELRNALERAIILGRGTTIELEDLPVEMRANGNGNGNGAVSSVETPAPLTDPMPDFDPVLSPPRGSEPITALLADSGHLFLLPHAGVDLESLEKDLVLQAITQTRGNKTGAGRLLGLNRDQVRHRLRKHGIIARAGDNHDGGDGHGSVAGCSNCVSGEIDADDMTDAL